MKATLKNRQRRYVRWMLPPIPLLVVPPVLLAIGAVLADDRARGPLAALAVAAAPLIGLLWLNLHALPGLIAGAPRGPLTVELLEANLERILFWTLVPAAIAWAILWFAPEASPCPRMPLRPLHRASLGAATTLIVVALVGGGLSLVVGHLGAETALSAGVWSKVPPLLMVGLALTAALAEELLFRGVLYASAVPATGFVGGAILQAVLFGLVHVAYGDPLYVVGAAAFGLVQAYVAVRWGLLVAFMVHSQVNLVILGWFSRGQFAVNGVITAATLALNLALIVPAALACLYSESASCPLSAQALGLPAWARERSSE